MVLARMFHTPLPMNRCAFLLLPLLLLVLPADGAAMASAPTEDQWPLRFTSGTDEVQVYAPQPEHIEGDHFTVRFAVSIKRAVDPDPVFGSVWGDGLMAVDRTTRLATLVSLEVSDVHFPDPVGREAVRIGVMLSREIPRNTQPFSIDWLIAALEEENNPDDAYWNEPPEVIYMERPAVLVYVDGDPQYLRLERPSTYGDPLYDDIATDVDRVLNTPYLLLRYRKSAHFLYGSGQWFKAHELLGPYANTNDVPASLRSLAASVDTVKSLGTATARVPAIVVRTTPAILLDLDGPPQMKPIQGTGLLYATNTDKDLFLEIATQRYFLLTAGRWSATSDLQKGPWRHVPPDQLPSDFARIPEGSPKDGVLAHVAGTAAAREAARDAYIPQTATVDRRTATLSVIYDGEPRFERIDGTDVYLAVNANTTVLRIQEHYHACHNAVWFDAPTAEGPWVVSTEVPARVEDIPPSSPAYNTRYVEIYDHDDVQVVTGYTPGYLGTYIQHGVVVMGTGFYYPYWPGLWYPRPFTWGFNMYYDPWMGWSFGAGWGWNWFYPGWLYGPWYGPAYTWYGWGPWGWWGPWHYCPPWTPNPRPAFYGHRPSLADGTSPRTPTASPMDLYRAERRPGVNPTELARPARPSPIEAPPAQPTATKPDSRDHFTDPAGNVYRRDGQQLQRYENGTWRPATTPAPPPARPPVIARPSPTPRPPMAPQEIQIRRDRGQQRVIDQRQYQQRPPAPQPRPAAPQQRQVAPQQWQQAPPPSPPARPAPQRKR